MTAGVLDSLLAVIAAGGAISLLYLWGRAVLALAGATVVGIDPVVPTLAGALALTVSVVAQVATGAQPSLLLTVAALVATVVGAVAWPKARARIMPTARDRVVVAPASLLARLVLAAAIVAVLSALWIAGNAPLGWDAVALWTLKARALESSASFRDHYLANVGDTARFHQDYPIAVPSVTWWLAQLGAGPVPRAASLAGVAWLAALPALVWTRLRPAVGAPVAAAIALALAVNPLLRGSAYGGMADLPLGVALLATVLELARDDAAGRRRAALMIALAASIKNEGMIVLAAVLLALVVDAVRTREWRRMRVVIPAVVVIAAWTLMLRGSGIAMRGTDSDSGTHGLGDIARVAIGERLPVLLAGLLDLVLLPSFLPVMLLFGGGMLYQLARLRLAHTHRTRETAPATAWLVVLLYLAGLLASYLMLVREPIGWLIETTLQRLIAAVAPSLAVLGALGLLDARDASTREPSTRDDATLSALRLADPAPAS